MKKLQDNKAVNLFLVGATAGAWLPYWAVLLWVQRAEKKRMVDDGVMR